MLFLSSLFYFIVIPYILSKGFFINKENHICKILLIKIDIIYIIDLIINFFRAYHNFDERLIKITKKIFIRYIKTWFLLDLIEAIPYFSIFQLYESKYNIINPLFNIVFLIFS